MSQSAISAEVFVHPLALCESSEVGAGTKIWPFAHIMAGASIGEQCNIGEQVFVEAGAVVGSRVTLKNQAMIWDGVVLEDDVFVGPGVIFTNDLYPRSARAPQAVTRYARRENWLVPTAVRKGASIGAGVVVVCGVTIGGYATVAAGALVTCDVPNHALFVGQPGRSVGWVCACGQPLNEGLSCEGCHQCFQRLGDSIEAVSR